MTAARQWAALQGALRIETAACAGKTAFTGERGDLAATARMRAACTACPVLEQCRDYAETAARSAAPITGFWAGRWR